jgi:hypothetical protein
MSEDEIATTTATIEKEDDSGTRNVWAVLTWVILVLTLVLNLVLIGILVVKRNLYSLINKLIVIVAIADLLYGCLVSPFFVENYIRINWEQSISYCRFYTYFFTFHDAFVPLCLVSLSVYVSLKFTGVTEQMKFKRPAYIGVSILVVVLSLLLPIPATCHATFFIDNRGEFKKECRTWDVYTMILTYCLSSSLLFCFTMSFLFSLCILGSPLLREAYDPEEHTQRWRLLLTLSLVNIFYIISGFLINFKDVSRFMFSCCAFEEPFAGINNVTYEVWSFVLLVAEPFFRPLVYLTFYLTYLLNNDNVY